MIHVFKVIKQTYDLFDGDKKSAWLWLFSKPRALNYRRPIKLALTRKGAKEVEICIHRIEHGVFI